jgi:hypothetical protein
MISATLVDLYTYEVVVEGSEAESETRHRVKLEPDYYQKLCGGTITHEWLIIQSFKFLLEREPNTAILREFNLEDINRYFPDYESEITARLGRPPA